MALEHFKTQVLLLHSEQSTLDALSSGFNDRYSVHLATSGTEALNTLYDTPVHVIVSAQDLPGMSGLEALREARKRSPETIGILLAGPDKNDGLEALVGEKEFFQIVRGGIEPGDLVKLIDSTTKQARLMALAESANDQSAGVDAPDAEHIVMETSEYGASIVSDGTGSFPALDPQKLGGAIGLGAREVDVLILSKDEEFLATIKDSVRGLHNIHHSVTPAQAEEVVKKHKIGVLVTDAAMVGSDVESLTRQLRSSIPRLVAIVAGRRDDGEMLMDLINRGHVYRFLLKPVSPGRARLAIEASVKHHLEAADSAFKGKPKPAVPAAKSRPALAVRKKPAPVAMPKPETLPKPKAELKPMPKVESKPAPKAAPKTTPKPEPVVKPEAKVENEEPVAGKISPTISGSPLDDVELDVDFGGSADQGSRFTETITDFTDTVTDFTDTMTDIAASVSKSISGATHSAAQSASGLAKSSGAAVTALPGKIPASIRNPKTIGIGAGAVASIAIAGWIFVSWESSPQESAVSTSPTGSAVSRTVTPPLNRPRTTQQMERSATETGSPAESSTPAVTPPVESTAATIEADDTGLTVAPISAELQAARTARDAERLIFPANDNAIDLYLAAAQAEPNSQIVQNELDDVIDRVLGLAEGAMLANDADEAASALDMVAKADADNPRLTFLSAQLTQLQLRETAGQARIAIREQRFGDAETLISQAGELAGSDAVEVTLLAQELTAAQNAQQAAEIITLAKERLDSGDLTTPENDNAQYFYEEALAVDPDNLAAQQGLIAVASKLVLQSRQSIDAGKFEAAAALLASAESIDPNNADLAASATALEEAREAVAEAARVAEAERLAELERQRQAEIERLAELERQAEAERLAELERQAEAQRLAELERQAEQERQAELQRQAEAQRLAELERQAELERLAAAERQAEIERQADLERQATLKAEADRLAEIDRLAEQERQAAAALQAEADQIEAEKRAIAQAEADRLAAEKQASAAAASSPLGVAGSKVSRTTTPSVNSGSVAQSTPSRQTNSRAISNNSSSPQPVAALDEPEVQPARTAAAAATTFALPGGGISNTPAPRQTPASRPQQASVVSPTFSPAIPRSAAAAETEMIPVSQLTRTNYVAPKYPRVAQRRNITGSVELTFTVTTDGRVRSASVIRSEPSETFDEAAMEAVANWRFEPVIENGVAVEKRTAVRLAFDLQE